MKASGFAVSIFEKICRSLLALCVGAALLPACAVASDEAGSGTVACGNSWELSYELSGEVATITGVAANGSGELVVPAEIEGASVLYLSAKCFYENTALTSIVLPATLKYVPSNCFQKCSALVTCTFEGTTLQKIEQYAFAGCTSLAELTVPSLTSLGKTLGDSCFADCSSLETLVFLGGNKLGVSEAFYGTSSVAGVTSLKTVIYFCKKGSVGTGSTASTTNSLATAQAYYSIDFYDSEADVEAGYSQRTGTVVYKSGTGIVSILSGEADSALAYTDPDGYTWSELPELEDGLIWGLGYEYSSDDEAYDYSYTVNGVDVGLTDSYNAVAIERGNLNYGWITSNAIEGKELTTNSHAQQTGFLSYYTFYKSLDGSVAALDSMVVMAADGTVLTEGVDYTLEFETAPLPYEGSTWTVVSRSDCTQTGYYRVHAVGVGSCADTMTFDVVFRVQDWELSVTELNGATSTITANSTVLSAGSSCYTSGGRNVLVSASDWQDQLIGAGLAGVGGGALLYDAGASMTSADLSKTVQAYNTSGATGLAIVGTTDEVIYTSDRSSGSAADNISLAKNVTPTRFSASGCVALAEQVYVQMRDKGEDVWGNTWGTEAGGKVAIVCSSTRSLSALPIAAYAYQMQAPVFFVGADGTLANSTLSYLCDFDAIVIAGDETYVSAAAEAAIQAATGVAPTRLLASSTNACENSIASAAAVGASNSTVVIATGDNPAAITSGALLAQTTGGSYYTVSSSADGKAVQALLAEVAAEASDSIEALYLVGDFSNTDPQLRERIESIWGTQLSVALTAADTTEASGLQTCGSTLTAVVETTISSVSLGGSTGLTGATKAALANISTLTISSGVSLAKVKTAGNTSLKKVTLASSITAIPASQFKGCSALTSINLTNVKTIGANAFANCTALKTITLGAKLTKIGKQAFSGCKALKTLTIKSTKLKKGKVGAKAFAGTATKITVKAPKKVLSKYKKFMQAKGISKKAKWKKC